MAEQLQPELALMDIQLQGSMSGIEAAKEIQRLTGAQIIFVTAFAGAFLNNPAQMQQPGLCLSKPYSKYQLETVLNAVRLNQSAGSPLPRHRLSLLQRPNFNPVFGQLFRQSFRRSGQGRECAVVHGNNPFHFEEPCRVRRLMRAHGEVIADGKNGQFRPVQFANQSHVPEQRRIAREVSGASIRQCQHVSRGFSAV